MAIERAVPLKYTKGSITQGSADAFVQGSITTALAGVTGLCWRVRELVLEVPNGTAAAANFEVAFTRKSFSAMPAMTEKSVIFRYKRSFSMTTSGASVLENVLRWSYPSDSADFLVVEDPVYVQLDSASTTLANVLSWSIGYEEAKIDESLRQALLIAALQ